MAIKFDELLEALDPSLDIDESLTYKSKKLKEAWEAEFESAYDALMNDNSLSEKEKDEALKQLFAEFGFNESLKEAIDPAKRDFFNKMYQKPFYAILDVCATLDDEGNPHDVPREWLEEWFKKCLDRIYKSYNESLNESKSSESILNELGDRIATGLRKEGFDAFFDYPGLTVMNTSYGLHVVNTPSVSVEDTNGKQIGTYPINTQNASTEAVSKIVKTIAKSLRK